MDATRSRRQAEAEWGGSLDKREETTQRPTDSAGKRVCLSAREFSDAPMPMLLNEEYRPSFSRRGGPIMTIGCIGLMYLFLVSPDWATISKIDTSIALGLVLGWPLCLLMTVIGFVLLITNRPPSIDYSHLSIKQQRLLGLPLTAYKPPAVSEEVTRAYPSPALAIGRSQGTSRTPTAGVTAVFRPLIQRDKIEISPGATTRPLASYPRSDGIMDEASLRRYAEHYERKYQSPQKDAGHGSPSPYRSSLFASPLSGTSPLAAWPSPSSGPRALNAGGSSSLPLGAARVVIPYTPSYREEPDKNQEGLTESVPLEDEKADTYIAHEAAKLLVRLGVSEQFSGWIQNMRFWISAVVIRPAAAALELSDQHLIQMAAQEVKRNSTLPMETRAMLSTTPPNMLQLTLYFTQRYSNSPVVQNRVFLEKYLEVSGVSHKGYVRQRLKALSQTENLGDYKWNSGGEWNGQAWKGHLPTDAQIVIHAFNTHMDRVIPQFSRDCFTEYSANQATRKKKAVEIVQIRFSPPYFALFHAKGRWLAEPGRHNLLATLVLFFFYIKEHSHGRLGQVALSDAALSYIDQIFGEEI